MCLLESNGSEIIPFTKGHGLGNDYLVMDEADLAFGVLPAYRGRGYGRQLLAQVVTLLASESWKRVLIEVETRNQNALGLYRSCGFREVTTYDFYRVRLAGLDSSP